MDTESYLSRRQCYWFLNIGSTNQYHYRRWESNWLFFFFNLINPPFLWRWSIDTNNYRLALAYLISIQKYPYRIPSHLLRNVVLGMINLNRLDWQTPDTRMKFMSERDAYFINHNVNGLVISEEVHMLPRTSVTVYQGETLYIRFSETTTNIQLCEVLREGSSQTEQMTDANCSVTIRDVQPDVNGVWTFIAHGDVLTLRGQLNISVVGM